MSDTRERHNATDPVSGREIEAIFRELSGFDLPRNPPLPMPPRPPMRLRNGPPPDMGRAVRWWLAGMLAGALMWAALIGAAVWTLGCATGTIG